MCFGPSPDPSRRSRLALGRIALVELGKALRTTFLCRYLHRMEPRREIHEGLNVVGGDIATNRLEDQEATMLALHLLQNCMVYVNTLMLQRVTRRADLAGAHGHQ